MIRAFAGLGLLLLIIFRAPVPVEAQPEAESSTYYVVSETAMLYTEPAVSPIRTFSIRDQVTMLQKGARWCKVRAAAGTVGYVRTEVLSNIWLRVSKAAHEVYVYRGAELIRTIPADLGYNSEDDKLIQGSTGNPDHWRTPEGRFYVADKNPNSEYYKALVLSYPSPEDARRGLRAGLISKMQYANIVKAAMVYKPPPMDTALGGWIEIHGQGTGNKVDWTRGCIAIPNAVLDVIWPLVSRGTPVIIE